MTMIDVPVALAAQASFALAASTQQGEADVQLLAKLKAASTGSGTQDAAQLRNRADRLCGTIMRLELQPQEWLFAEAITSALWGAQDRWAVILSRWSRCEAGWALVHGRSIKWHDEYSPILEHRPAEASEPAPSAMLMPMNEHSSRRRIAARSRRPYRLRVELGQRLTLYIEPADARDGHIVWPQRASWVINLHSGSKETPLRGIAVKFVGPDKSTLALEASSPESVLRLSGAAEAGRWLSARGDGYGAVFPAPSLELASPSEDVWVSGHDHADPYLRAPDTARVRVPVLTLAKAALVHRWVAAPGAPAFVAALAEEFMNTRSSQ